MNVLVLGGTRFVGRHVAHEAHARGHAVTVFHRGVTGPDVPAEAEHVYGDRRAVGGLAPLLGRGFDLVFDTSAYWPGDVRALEALAGGIGHYAFMSSLSVLREPVPAGADESADVWELAEPLPETIDSAATYGGLKVLCERAAAELFGDRALAVRAGFVVGPHDYSERFVHWPRRLARGGRVLAGSDPAQPVQLIDVRDLAAWIVAAAERRLAGTFNVTGPAYELTLGALLERCARVAGADAELVWARDEDLLLAGIEPAQELPFWLPSAHADFCRVRIAKAIGAGLRFRDLEETIADTVAWDAGRSPGERTDRLDPEREAAILARIDHR